METFCVGFLCMGGHFFWPNFGFTADTKKMFAELYKMNDAHRAFLASQDPLHPILQQIQATSQMYPSYPGPGAAVPNPGPDNMMLAAAAAAASNNPATDDVSLDIAQEGLQESTRFVWFGLPSYSYLSVCGCWM